MSTAADVSAAVAAAVTALNLTGVTVEQLKIPAVPGAAPLPQAVVSVGDEGDFEYLTATTKLVTYPCAVTLVTKGGRKLEDDETLRTWRASVWAAVEARATWAGLTGWNETLAGGKEPFDRAALSKDLNWSVLVFRVCVEENRA